jgi:glycosyltransferase involved in cell wall biosynthesis
MKASAIRSPLKVLHLVTGLERGGAETMLVKLAAGMDRARFAPFVVSLMDEGSLGGELRRAGVPLFSLGLRRGRPSFAAVLRLRRIIRQERPDLLQTWLYHADFLGMMAVAMTPALPLVWNLRCSDMDLARYSWQTRAIRRLLAWSSAARPDAVVVNSEAGRRYHAALGYRPRRWEMIPNGFDVERFRPDAAARARWRERLGVGTAQPLVGMVARVDPMKDHATFLAAAAELAERRPDAAFLLVGRGTEDLAVPAALDGRLHALGERGDVAALLPALDLMVLPSAFGEGFPNVLGEAMACGVPCIASDVGDAAAILGETGAIVPPRDARALAASLLAWLDRDPAEQAAGARAARQRIVDSYALPAIIERYQRLYDALARRG